MHDNLCPRPKSHPLPKLVLRKEEIMEDKKNTYHSIEEYISQFSPEVQEILKKIQQVIKEAAPEAKEKISYQMPTFYLHGNLVHFAAHKKHIGLYPTSSGVAAFAQRLTEYKTSRGAIQLPLTKPIPYDLIREITMFRVQEAKERSPK